MNFIFDNKYISAEQRILWRKVKPLIAYTTITPLNYQGVIAGSEFETYSADKLYVAFLIEFEDTTTPGANAPYVTFYDELNAAFYVIGNAAPYWDAAAAAPKYVSLQSKAENLYFSRIVRTVYPYMRFIGYRFDV